MRKILIAIFVSVGLFGALPESDVSQIENLKSQINSVQTELQNNIWLTRYNNYITYQKLSEDLEETDKQIAKLSSSKDKQSVEKIQALAKKSEILERQMELLEEFKRSPFSEIIRPPEIAESEKISNPIAIISGFSYIKQLKSQKEEFWRRLYGLEELIDRLEAQKATIEELVEIEPSVENGLRLESINKEINEFVSAKDIASTTFAVYEKRVEEVISKVGGEIKAQMKTAINIGIFIVVVIVLSFLLKLVAKKYITNNERFYTANKAINFINFTIILLILMFAYIENVTYLVTVVGFASAGLAIAMKDMFMSLLGWIVITFGGSFHVGDRIRVQKDGAIYVGDIVDISLLRMTVFEDITLTTYLDNRRAGRIVFVPNNYIFTTLISNYTHHSIKTVWDGIDITITFDSNHKKAVYLIKNIVKKYSKGYTDIARKQLNMLRDHYSLRNANVEPRIFTFLEPHGITVSVWYMTNSYAALVLRSTLSADIIDMINSEDDINIAFPTQTLHLKNQTRSLPLNVNKDVLF